MKERKKLLKLLFYHHLQELEVAVVVLVVFFKVAKDPIAPSLYLPTRAMTKPLNDAEV
jgi:hypothetical protein